ncbi:MULTISPECIES: LysM peptidoglycan-binding domain-containing protein [Rothia]|nr:MULTISPECIES: LysM peptidoglycan-binding domain-containing protein [Rothia]
MSTIALPEFMARTSLKKPLDQTATFAPRQQPQPSATAGGLRQPRYRIRRAESSPVRSHQAGAPAQRRVALVPATSMQLPQRPKMRLTRRGRFIFRGLPLLTLAALLVLGALTLLLPTEAKSSAETPVAPSSSTVTVMHGDSLWSIAADVAPGEDNRDVINHIMQINNLTTAQVEPGQVLEVPVYSQ